MALTDDLALHQTLHLQSLGDLLHGMPTGLADQLAELSPVVATFERTRADIQREDGRTADAQIETARAQATAAIEAWRSGKVAGVTAQIASTEQALAAAAAQVALPPRMRCASNSWPSSSRSSTRS